MDPEIRARGQALLAAGSSIADVPDLVIDGIATTLSGAMGPNSSAPLCS